MLHGGEECVASDSVISNPIPLRWPCQHHGQRVGRIDSWRDPNALGQMMRWIVEVHQVVKDRDGKLLLDTVVHHAYRIENGLIVRMDIE